MLNEQKPHSKELPIAYRGENLLHEVFVPQCKENDKKRVKYASIYTNGPIFSKQGGETNFLKSFTDVGEEGGGGHGSCGSPAACYDCH